MSLSKRMDFLLGILLCVVGAVIGMTFMVFAPIQIRKKIINALNPDAKVTSEEKIVSTTSSSYFDSGSGSTFLRGSSSDL